MNAENIALDALGSMLGNQLAEGIAAKSVRAPSLTPAQQQAMVMGLGPLTPEAAERAVTTQGIGDGEIADGAASGPRRTIDPRRALGIIDGRLSATLRTDTSERVRARIDNAMRDLADPRFADMLRREYVLTPEQAASVEAAQQQYDVVRWSDDSRYRHDLSGFAQGYRELDDDIVRLHALTNIAQASNPGYQIDGDVTIGRMPLLLARDTMLLGLPSRVIGGYQAIMNGPAGYDGAGQPVYINPNTHSYEYGEQIGLETAGAASMPAPGKIGPGVLRSGLTLGYGASERVAATLSRVEAESLRLPNVRDELLTAISPETGEVLAQVLHPGGKGRAPESFLDALNGAILTHNHPSGGPIGFEDVMTGLTSGATQIRAVGSRRTYVLEINLPSTGNSPLRSNFTKDTYLEALSVGREVVAQHSNFRNLSEEMRVKIMSPKLHDFLTNLGTQHPNHFKYSVIPTSKP